MNLEKIRIEHESTLEDPTSVLLNIYEAKDKGGVNELQKTLSIAESKLEILENKEGKEKIQDNQDWLVNNNNRINLYQISAALKGEKYNLADEDMDKIRAEQFFAYRQIQASLITAGEIQQPESVSLLADFINRKSENSYLSNTAIDSLAKNGLPESKEKINEIVNNEKYNFEIRTRAVLAGLRSGISFDSEKISKILSQYLEILGDKLCQSTGTYNIIEIAGLLPDKIQANNILEKLDNRLEDFPLKDSQWFKRDVISTRLNVEKNDQVEYLNKQLANRHYIAQNGIVFGSLDAGFDFSSFLPKQQDKFDKIAEVVDRLNKVFQTEPILYIDISSGDANEAGWTQNSIYFSSDYMNHRHEVNDLQQSAGHEACERWQSKGFVDTQLSKFYLQLMGQKYNNSQLDKFRLKYRIKEKTQAGHPWDGEREFIAELGSTLLVDPEVIPKLFDSKTDKLSLESLEYLKNKLDLKK